MKILHTADLHLGKVLHEAPLLDDQAAILDQILELCRCEQADVLVVAGDIYDRSIPPPEAVSLFSQWLANLRRSLPHLAILLIPGNHDSAARLRYGREIFQAAGIHWAPEPEACAQPVTLSAGGVTADFFLLPFLNAGALSVPDDEGQPHPLRTQQDLTTRALELMQANLTPGRPAVLVAHLYTVGGEASDSERLFVGTAELVEAGVFAPFAYTALGHLHRPQSPAPRVRYPGSPLAYSFSEAGQPKSVTLVHLQADGQIQLEFLPLQPLYPAARLKGTWAEITAEDTWPEHRNSYLEITVTDDYLPPQPMAVLRQKFPRVLNLRLEAAEERILTALNRSELRASRSAASDFEAFYRQLGWEEHLAEDSALFAGLLAEVDQ